MKLKLDAWLESRKPYVRVLDMESGRTVVHFEGEPLQALLANGEIEAEALYGTDPEAEHELIRRLMLLGCKYLCHERPGSPACLRCDRRPPGLAVMVPMPVPRSGSPRPGKAC